MVWYVESIEGGDAMSLERHYTIRDIVEQAGIRETTVRAALASGELQSVRFSPQGRYHIPESAYLRWLAASREKHSAGAAPEPEAARLRAPPPRRATSSVLELLPTGYKRRFV